MAFVNEMASPEDIELYGLRDDYPASRGRIGPYSNLEIRDSGNRWTINRDECTYLRSGGLALESMGLGKPGHFYFLINFRGNRMFPVVKFKEIMPRDEEKKIYYRDCFLAEEFIPDNMGDLRGVIIWLLKDALNVYKERMFFDDWNCVLNFKF
jgi:hypothetical protein